MSIDIEQNISNSQLVTIDQLIAGLKQINTNESASDWLSENSENCTKKLTFIVEIKQDKADQKELLLKALINNKYIRDRNNRRDLGLIISSLEEPANPEKDSLGKVLLNLYAKYPKDISWDIILPIVKQSFSAIDLLLKPPFFSLFSWRIWFKRIEISANKGNLLFDLYNANPSLVSDINFITKYAYLFKKANNPETVKNVITKCPVLIPYLDKKYGIFTSFKDEAQQHFWMQLFNTHELSDENKRDIAKQLLTRRNRHFPNANLLIKCIEFNPDIKFVEKLLSNSFTNPGPSRSLSEKNWLTLLTYTPNENELNKTEYQQVVLNALRKAKGNNLKNKDLIISIIKINLNLINILVKPRFFEFWRSNPGENLSTDWNNIASTIIQSSNNEQQKNAFKVILIKAMKSQRCDKERISFLEQLFENSKSLVNEVPTVEIPTGNSINVSATKEKLIAMPTDQLTMDTSLGQLKGTPTTVKIPTDLWLDISPIITSSKPLIEGIPIDTSTKASPTIEITKGTPKDLLSVEISKGSPHSFWNQESDDDLQITIPVRKTSNNKTPTSEKVNSGFSNNL